MNRLGCGILLLIVGFILLASQSGQNRVTVPVGALAVGGVFTLFGLYEQITGKRVD